METDLSSVLYEDVVSGEQVVLLQRATLLNQKLPLVVYQSATTGVVWALPQVEFFDGRFQKVIMPGAMYTSDMEKVDG